MRSKKTEKDRNTRGKFEDKKNHEGEERDEGKKMEAGAQELAHTRVDNASDRN